MTNPIKLCKDCKFFTPFKGLCTHKKSIAYVRHEANWHKWIVHGKTNFCAASEMRLNWVDIEVCGEDGKFFERRKQWWRIWR
jgi:hypothetical protein